MIAKRLPIICFILCPLLSAQTTTSDFATEQLFQIASKEEQIYKKIAEDPDFYTEDDLDRRINDLVQAYRTYLTDHPKDVNALILYGKLLRRVELYEEAFNAFLKADSLDPTIPVVKQQIGTYLAEQGKGKAALPFYLNAIDLEPETAVYHFALGQLLYKYKDDFLKEGLFTEAALEREGMQAFRQACRLDPENFDFNMRLGEAYYDMRSPDWHTALTHWDAMLEKFGQSGLRQEILNLHKANVLAQLGRYTEARQLAESVKEPNLQFSKQKVLDAISLH